MPANIPLFVFLLLNFYTIYIQQRQNRNGVSVLVSVPMSERR